MYDILLHGYFFSTILYHKKYKNLKKNETIRMWMQKGGGEGELWGDCSKRETNTKIANRKLLLEKEINLSTLIMKISLTVALIILIIQSKPRYTRHLSVWGSLIT